MNEPCKHYVPFEDEPYMNPKQLHYFRQMLLQRRKELTQENSFSRSRLQEEGIRQADFLDQCVASAGREMLLISQSHRQRILEQVDGALKRIKDGNYGYCEETGEEIGIRRLRVYPMAHLSVEAQEYMERMGHKPHQNAYQMGY